LVVVDAAGMLRCAFRSERIIAWGIKKARDAGATCRDGIDEQAEAPRTKGNAVEAEIGGKKNGPVSVIVEMRDLGAGKDRFPWKATMNAMKAESSNDDSGLVRKLSPISVARAIKKTREIKINAVFDDTLVA
ncbi:hypothetical protein, partial [Salinicola socius]